ncbi:MAG TPA: hypothetical protein DDW52_01130 [Planctomycetaceae bacterium]|nr:hypothetical protein [Planctomycetaceae bacterium]
MGNSTVESFVLSSLRSELKEIPLRRSGVDCTSERIEDQLEAIADLLAQARHEDEESIREAELACH